jgi:GDP-4-dehydro-6-deoxy-D-mannose reductase
MLSMGDGILITGSNGFLGRALSKRLIMNGEYDIKSFDINNGNIFDYDFSNYEVKHVCHLAARTFVPQSWEEPFDYYKVNFLGTLNILEYCRKHNASMTFISTYMYGTPQYLPIDEKHPREAHSVYNHTKLLAEDICEFYSKHYNNSITVLRLFNVYGIGQRQDFLIPSIINQALNNNIIEVTDTRPKRDFIYIDDVIDAICLSIGLSGYNVYNVGSGISFSVSEIIKIICDILGEEKKVIDKKQIRTNEIMDTIADIKKIKTELAWEPKTNFVDGIKYIIDDNKSGVINDKSHG